MHVNMLKFAQLAAADKLEIDCVVRRACYSFWWSRATCSLTKQHRNNLFDVWQTTIFFLCPHSTFPQHATESRKIKAEIHCDKRSILNLMLGLLSFARNFAPGAVARIQLTSANIWNFSTFLLSAILSHRCKLDSHTHTHGGYGIPFCRRFNLLFR